jgi:DnaJ like chaperone protein
MHWTGKLIGGLLGLILLGPVGAVIGLVLGHMYDEHMRTRESLASGEPGVAVGERFFRTAFEVMGHVAKADGRVSEREIAAARSVMAELRLDDAQMQAAIAYFTAGKQPEFSLDAALEALRRSCAFRPDLLRIFVEIQLRAALTGNDLTGPSRRLLQRIAASLGVSALELAHMEAVLRIRRGNFSHGAADSARPDKLQEAYRVLGVEPSASDAELARAYRRQLSRHHPDKLKANGLPDSMLEHAKERTQQIIEAYELIRERRKHEKPKAYS